MVIGIKKILSICKKYYNFLFLEKKSHNEDAFLVFDFLKNLAIGEKFIATAGSESMEPLIFKGDEILIERVKFKNLKKGDVLAFWSKELKNVVVHRFHSLENGKIITKGDNNLYSDLGSIDSKSFLGLMIKVL